MRAIKMAGLTLAAALMLVAALVPAGAMASGATALKLETEGKELVGGAPLSALSTNLTLSNAFWSLTCAESVLSGDVGVNDKAKDDFNPISEASFHGGDPSHETLCASTFEFVVSYEPQQTSELILAKNGSAQLRFPRFKLVPLEDVENPEGHHEACVLSSNAIKGTFPVSETPQALVLTFTSAKMHLDADHGEECGSGKGASAFLSATFTFGSRGTEVDVVRYARR